MKLLARAVLLLYVLLMLPATLYVKLFETLLYPVLIWSAKTLLPIKGEDTNV